MKFHWFIGLVCVLFMTISSTLAARRLAFRPLSADEVYNILKESGREDAVPEGRIVTQGLAAISGFALGISKGIAIPLAIGLATSNATQEFFNNINYTAIANSLPTIPPITLPTINYTAISNSLPKINYTALTAGLPTINYTALTSSIPTINLTAVTNLLKGSSNNANVQYTTQEICFNSRSLNDINDEDYENDDDEEVVDYADEDGVSDNRQAAPTTGTNTGTNTETNATPTTSAAMTPTTRGIVQINTGTQTNTNNGGNTATDTDTTTETGGRGAINCVVIQKPVSG